MMYGRFSFLCTRRERDDFSWNFLSLCFFASATLLVVGFKFSSILWKLVPLEAFHLPLANNNDGALGAHLTRGLGCKLCPAPFGWKAAAKMPFETLWADFSSIPALLYFVATSGLLSICRWIFIHDTHKPSKLQEEICSGGLCPNPSTVLRKQGSTSKWDGYLGLEACTLSPHNLLSPQPNSPSRYAAVRIWVIQCH